MAIGPHPEFAWSVSRANLFDFCPRKYYYRYYGMWGGWQERADEKTRLCYLLSRRTSLAGWAGQEVHRAIASYLASDRAMSTIMDETRQRMRDQYRSSLSRQWLEPGGAKRFGLVEHYYEQRLEDAVVRERWEQVAACLEAFAAAAYREDARRARDAGRLVYVESPDEADFSRMGVSDHGLGDFRIYAQPDFAVGYEDGSTCILDWKTGRPPAEGQDAVTDQLGLYALWAREQLELDPEARCVEAYEVYWPDEQSRGDRIGPERIAAALDHARASVAEMHRRLVDPQANAAREQDFEPAASEAKCAVCEYRAVCPDRVGG